MWTTLTYKHTFDNHKKSTAPRFDPGMCDMYQIVNYPLGYMYQIVNWPLGYQAI